MVKNDNDVFIVVSKLQASWIQCPLSWFTSQRKNGSHW